MTKTILFANNVSKEMTFEEVYKKFTPAVIKEMKRANGRFLYNAVEEADFKQELYIELWRAYEAYDASTGNCFSTYLFYKLRKGTRNATFSKYAKKNQNEGVFSMSAAIPGCDDLTIEDSIKFSVADNLSEDLLSNELASIIDSVLITDSDKELAFVLFNKEDYSVEDYAAKHGLTRQGANQRVIKLKKRLQKAVTEKYFKA